MPTFEPCEIPRPIWAGWMPNKKRKTGPCSKRWHDTWTTLSGSKVTDGIETKTEKQKDEESE